MIERVRGELLVADRHAATNVRVAVRKLYGGGTGVCLRQKLCPTNKCMSII